MNDTDSAEIDALKQQISDLQILLSDYPSRAQLAENQLIRIYKSPAWKLSKPLRLINLLAWRIKPELKQPVNPDFDLTRNGPTVFESIQRDLLVELDNCDFGLDKIALVAQWSPTENIPNSTSLYIEELARNGFGIVVVSTSPASEGLRLSELAKSVSTVIRRPNLGYDFGSWSVAFNLYPELFEKSEVLVTNDSCYGPIGSLSEILKASSDSRYDITSLTDNAYMRYHLQSYFLHFKSRALKSKTIQKFWKNIHAQESKTNVIIAYEIGLSSQAQNADLYAGALFPWNSVSNYWSNPSVESWQKLLAYRFPFIKREVVRSLNSKERRDLTNQLKENFNCSQGVCDDIVLDAEIR